MKRNKVCRIPKFFIILYIGSIIAIFLANAIIFSFLSAPNECNCPQCPGKSNIIYNSIDEITFITCPRPLTPDKYNSMKLALSSWLAASPKSHVLVFVNRTEFDPSGKLPDELDQLFGPNRITYAGSIRHDHKGVPYIDDWFRQGIKKSHSKYVSFINTDIPISNNWLRRVKQVFAVMGNNPTVLIGQRIDFDMNEDLFKNLRFDQKNLLKDIDKMVQESKHKDHSPFGVDSFTFRIDNLPFDYEMIPSFIMGRYNWDNWVVGWLNNIAETVTFNLNPPIYHINHKRHNFDPKDDKVAVNHHFKKANNDYFGSNYDTKWEVIDDNLVRRNIRTSVKLPNIK